MKPDEKEDQLTRAGAELDAMMRLFETDRGGEFQGEASGDDPGEAYEAQKRRDVAELVFRIEALRRRRRMRTFVASACGVAACLALWLVPFGGGEPSGAFENYDVPVLIVDNKAPVALTPDGHSMLGDSRDEEAVTAAPDAIPEAVGGPVTAVGGQAATQASGVPTPEPSIHRILVPAGQTYTLQLADGSKVVINAESSVSFPVPFDASLRELTLRGEACFEITHSEAPFEVVAGTTRIRVYGTRFNVKESEDLGTVTAVLAEGSVGMKLPDGRELRMHPDEKLSYDAETGSVTLQNVDSEECLAWIKGRFKYTDTPIAEVLDDLAKWYGVNLESPDVGLVTLTLDMSRKAPLEVMLADLELLVGKKIRIENR